MLCIYAYMYVRMSTGVQVQISDINVKGITIQCSTVHVIASLMDGVLGSTIKPYSFASRDAL